MNGLQNCCTWIYSVKQGECQETVCVLVCKHACHYVCVCVCLCVGDSHRENGSGSHITSCQQYPASLVPLDVSWPRCLTWICLENLFKRGETEEGRRERGRRGGGGVRHEEKDSEKLGMDPSCSSALLKYGTWNAGVKITEECLSCCERKQPPFFFLFVPSVD